MYIDDFGQRWPYSVAEDHETAPCPITGSERTCPLGELGGAITIDGVLHEPSEDRWHGAPGCACQSAVDHLDTLRGTGWGARYVASVEAQYADADECVLGRADVDAWEAGRYSGDLLGTMADEMAWRPERAGRCGAVA